MKNRSQKIIIFLILLNSFIFKLFAQEPFIFEVTEINISKNGTFFKADKRGEILSDNGLKIIADKFEYDKLTNILNLYGNISIEDEKNDILVSSEKVIYFKNQEKFFSEGKTKALIHSKYSFKSVDVYFDKKEMSLSSSQDTIVNDSDNNKYESGGFKYLINESLLKAENIVINHKKNKSNNFTDKFFFKDAFINLENENFLSNETLLEFHKNIFDRSENDPRISSISSKKNEELTILNKAVFTSCKKNDGCPPWSIKANKITHNKAKKQLIYDKAVLQIYDFPILYFPKFFHPDPSVIRQSGFLKPILNKSNIVGTSIQFPYFKVLDADKDLTLKPTIFNKNTIMMQNEYRQENKFSSFIADFAFIKGYTSATQANVKKNINHFFSKFNLDLNLPNFSKSVFSLKTEKVNNDNYLKIFEGNLTNTSKLLLPLNKNKLSSEAMIELYGSDYSFTTSLNVYEDLKGKNSDRYQYILPRYELTKNYTNILNLGLIDFRSLGDNNLKNTNNLTSRIINDISFKSNDKIIGNTFVNNFGIYIKNLNTIAKNDQIYKDSLQLQLMGIAELNTSLPLVKSDGIYYETLTPKLSLKFNPGDMKNYTNVKKKVNYSNIYSVNRLGLTDSFESGKSLTVGFDFKKESIENINNFFEFKIGKVLRDKDENNIPISSTIDKSDSNYFGKLNIGLNSLFNFNYDFSINKNFDALEYSDLKLTFSKNNFFAELNYLEENNNIGNEHFIENIFGYDIDEYNLLKFKTRRNKKINLTEFYDLIYEYKNDCLTAGINFKKTFYNDRDIRPSENLMFTITLFPLTTFEQSINNNF